MYPKAPRHTDDPIIAGSRGQYIRLIPINLLLLEFCNQAFGSGISVHGHCSDKHYITRGEIILTATIWVIESG